MGSASFLVTCADLFEAKLHVMLGWPFVCFEDDSKNEKDHSSSLLPGLERILLLIFKQIFKLYTHFREEGGDSAKLTCILF